MRNILLGLALFLAATNVAGAVTITKNGGGVVVTFAHEIERLINSGEKFEVDGICASACTLILQAPAGSICVTPRAAFGFHTAYKTNIFTGHVTDIEVSQYLISKYPPAVQEWINSRGGLTPDVIWLQGKELSRMFPACNGALAAMH